MKRIITVAVAASVALGVGLVAAPGSAMASSAAVLLGLSNSSSHATGLTNSYGTPLLLRAKPGYAPLAVNNTTKVSLLNSDLLDGYSSASFAKVAGKTATVVGADAGIAAHCPSGTLLVGGGGLADGGLMYSGPDTDSSGNFSKNSWDAIGYDSVFGSAISFAQCYSPSGASIPGAITPSSTTSATLSKGARMYLKRMGELQHKVTTQAGNK